MPKKFDTDVLNHLNETRVANITLGVIDYLQDYRVEEQMVALSASFMMLAKHLGIEPSSLWSVTNNIVNHAEGTRPEFKGVQAYMNGEFHS